MAGSVGTAVAGLPGYAGYVPSSQQPLICSNTLVTEKMAVDAWNRRSQKIGRRDEVLKDTTFVFLPKRGTEASLYQAAGAVRSDPADWTQPRTKANLLTESKKRHEAGATAAGSPAAGERFTAKTSYTAANSVEKNKDAAFYSRVQQEEYRDAIVDMAAPALNTRSSAKQAVPTEKKLQKRKVDGGMRCCEAQYEGTVKRSLLGAEPVTSKDLVTFLGTHQQVSSYQREYGNRGHVPTKVIPTSTNPMDLSRTATTGDLGAGTAKSALGLRLPGYMGHVPSQKRNADTLHETTGGTKDIRLMTTSKRTLPGYTGFEPRSLVNDTGRANCPPVDLTSSGSALASALKEAGGKPNNSEFAKKGGIRHFFTQGGGQPDHSISEQYFVKFRPMEGSLKMGPPAERAVPRTK
eukprot:gene11580-17838_t